MADPKGPTGPTAIDDLKMLIAILVVLWLMWYMMGGATKFENTQGGPVYLQGDVRL